MQNCFLVKGGNILKGEIKVNGAKNSVLKSMAAALLFSDEIKIENVPLVEDVFRMAELLIDLGVIVKLDKKNRTITINPSSIKKTNLNPEIAKRIRASIVLIGPLLARLKKASFPYPGGCVIGKRPIDLFLDGWQRMNAKITENEQHYEISVKNLKGCEFTFRNVSVTATETLMMTAVLAENVTVLKNAALEPEIQALAQFLNQCGADIKGAGTSTIVIKGTSGKLLKSKNKKIKTIPDRIETGSFLVIGALLGDPVIIKNCDPEHVMVPIAILKSAGVNLQYGKDWIQISRSKKIKSADLKTQEYPGLPTDLQAPFVVLMTQAQGESVVFETVFEGRLNYIEELNRMAAKITLCDPHRAIIRGPAKLHGREIESPDIRAGLAFLIASLIAKGKSKINNIYQIDRGYEKIEERLNNLGASIKRVKS